MKGLRGHALQRGDEENEENTLAGDYFVDGRRGGGKVKNIL